MDYLIDKDYYEAAYDFCKYLKQTHPRATNLNSAFHRSFLQVDSINIEINKIIKDLPNIEKEGRGFIDQLLKEELKEKLSRKSTTHLRGEIDYHGETIRYDALIKNDEYTANIITDNYLNRSDFTPHDKSKYLNMRVPVLIKSLFITLRSQLDIISRIICCSWCEKDRGKGKQLPRSFSDLLNGFKQYGKFFQTDFFSKLSNLSKWYGIERRYDRSHLSYSDLKYFVNFRDAVVHDCVDICLFKGGRANQLYYGLILFEDLGLDSNKLKNKINPLHITKLNEYLGEFINLYKFLIQEKI